jgi:H+/Na+-translocating ferredoxin:NAD+ oxidoreductase subunit G
MKTTTLRLVLTLFVVCGIAAGSLAFVNAATKERIAEFARTEKIEAMKRVLPEAELFIETVPGKAWDGQKSGQLVGRVLAASIQGYSGPIQSFVGLDASNAVTGVSILSQSETPGLGARIAEEKFLKQFRGLAPEAIALRRDDPAGKVDAITAATISSRAVTVSLRRAVDAYLKGDLK